MAGIPEGRAPLRRIIVAALSVFPRADVSGQMIGKLGDFPIA
jgi:hypothetical protein